MAEMMVNLVEEDIAKMATPNEAVIQAINEEHADAAPPVDSVAAPSDVSSNSAEQFDPTIHCTNEDGSPRLTATGKFRRRRGAAQIQANANSLHSSNMLAVAVVDTMIGMCLHIDVEDWQPIKSETCDERQNLISAYQAYFQARGITEPPAWVVLVLANAGYFLPRLTKPNTQTKLQRTIAWIRRKIGL